MWNQLLSDYYILFNIDDQQVELHLTDFMFIWYKCFSMQEFAACLKESNRLIEIEESVLLSKAVDMLKNIHSATKVQAGKDRNNAFNIEITRIEGFPIRFKVCLDEGGKDMFFHKITQPLLRTINDLRSSEKELGQLLLRKDKEIQEYKEEGGKIALRHLKTPKFDQQIHLNTHSCYSRYFGVSDIPLDIICREQKMKKESAPVAIKEEPNNGTTSTAAVTSMAAVKLESTSSLSIKQEPSSQASNVSPRKRKKMLNL